MGNKYPNSVGYDGLKSSEVRQAALEADYRRKRAVDDNLRRLRSQQGYRASPRIRFGSERVTIYEVAPALDLREIRPRYHVATPFGSNAPLAGIGYATGAPVTVGDLLNRYGGNYGPILEGQWKDVTGSYSQKEKDAARYTRWARRVLQAMGLLGRVSPWGRALDVLDFGFAIAEQIQQHAGGVQRLPAGWGSPTTTCNPVQVGPAELHRTRGTQVVGCPFGQAVSPQWLTTDRYYEHWVQNNVFGTRWALKYSHFYGGALPNPGQPYTSLPMNLEVTEPGVASLDAAYNRGQPSKTPLSIPFHLRAGRPNNMFFQQGYGNKVDTQTGNQVTIIPPSGPPIVVTRPPAAKPPPPGTKEKKAKLTKNGVDVLRVVGIATESLDVLDCLHGALPPKYWAKGVKLETPHSSPFAKNYFGKGEYRAPTAGEKSKAVYDHFNAINWTKFTTCVVTEQLEDFVIGKVSKKVRANSKRASPNRPFGWLVGPAI